MKSSSNVSLDDLPYISIEIEETRTEVLKILKVEKKSLNNINYHSMQITEVFVTKRKKKMKLKQRSSFGAEETAL